MNPIYLLPLALVLGTGDDDEKLPRWKKHETLASLNTDWQAQKDSKLEVTTQGVVLVGNSRIASRFQLADGSRITFLYTTNNRNAVVQLCGKEITAKATNAQGQELYMLDIVRRGRALAYNISVVDNKGKIVGKPVNSDAIQIDEEAVDRPSWVVFSSHPVWRNTRDINTISDIRFKSIVVNGPVLPPPGSNYGKKK